MKHLQQQNTQNIRQKVKTMEYNKKSNINK